MNSVKSTGAKLIVAACCIAATHATVWQIQRRTRLEAAEAEKFDVTTLPMKFGKWSGANIELDPNLFRQTGALSIANRSYQNEAGYRASLHIATYSTADVTLPHPPDLCYSTAGWGILKDEWQNGGGDFRYRLMIADQNGAKTGVVYWYQLGSHVASNREELRRILQKLRLEGKKWPPLVKVLLTIPITLSEKDATFAAEDFGKQIYDWVSHKS